MTLREYMHAVESRPTYWNVNKVMVNVRTDWDWAKNKNLWTSPWEIPVNSHLWDLEVHNAFIIRDDTPYCPYRNLCIFIEDFVDPLFPNGRTYALTYGNIQFI